MLLGRQRERRRLEALLEQARAGGSGALLLIGESGIGKSALLADALARAEGLTRLWARGVESEIELAFSGLAHLLRPVLGHLEAIPGPQAAAIAGALALGPPAHASSSNPVALWVDMDGASQTTASGVLLVQSLGGFTGTVAENESLCFYESSIWSPSLTLPVGC